MLKISIKFGALAVLAGVLFSSRAHAIGIGAQFLADDFEAGLGSWFAEGAGGAVSITADAFAGTGALQVDYAADFEGARINIPLNPIDRFSEISLGFVYKETLGGPSLPLPPGLRAALVEFSPSGVSFHNADFLFGGPLWAAAPATPTFTLDRADADSLALIFQGHANKPGSFLVDNVTLSKLAGDVHSRDSFVTTNAPAFGYTVGSGLATQNPSVPGYFNPWTQEIDVAGTTSSNIQANSLAYTDSSGDQLATFGGSASLSAAAATGNVGVNKQYRVVDTGPTSPFAPFDVGPTGKVNDGTLYFSFLMQQNLTTADVAHGAYVRFNDQGTPSLRIGHRDDVGYVIGIDDDPFSPQIEIDPSLEDSTGTNLFVVKLELSSSSFTDTATVWMNPELGLASDPVGGTVLTGENIEFSRIYIDAITGGTAGVDPLELQVDEFRFGTSFAEVTPIAALVDNADFDGDGDIDGLDFLTWQRGLGTTGVPGTLQSQGDANDNGTIDGSDLAVWETQFGTVAALGAFSSAVPEPSCLLLATIGFVFLGSRYRSSVCSFSPAWED